MFGLYGDDTQYEMKQYALDMYNEFFANPRRESHEYTFAGRIKIATSPEGSEQLQRISEGRIESEPEVRHFGGEGNRGHYEFISGDDLKRTFMMPEIDTDPIKAALYRPTAGFINDPKALTYEFLDRAQDNGAKVEADTRIHNVITENGQVTGITTEDGGVEVDEVISAAGPWNIKLAQKVGIDLPVKHLRTPVVTIESKTSAGYIHPTLEHCESDYHLYRRSHDAYEVVYWPANYDVAERYDPDSVNDEVTEETRMGIREFLELLAPSLADADFVDERVCTISVTPDGNPILGWTEIEGFSIAAFHTSGIQLAPATGKIIAKQLLDETPTELYDSLSISRFEDYTDHHEG